MFIYWSISLGMENKTNIVPIHEKWDKQTVTDLCSVSLLMISSKIFERLLYNKTV